MNKLQLNCPDEVYINSNFECELNFSLNNSTNGSGNSHKIEITYDYPYSDGTKKIQAFNFVLRSNDITSLRKLKFTTSGEIEFKALSINNGLYVNPIVKSK